MDKLDRFLQYNTFAMSLRIAINGRYSLRRVTGVERYASEISKRLGEVARLIVPTRALGLISGHIWEQMILPFRMRRGEILWSPANAGPWGVSRQVVTLHDASVFDHPEWFQPAFARWTRLSWRLLAKRVRVIITVSNFSCQRLMRYLRLTRSKIRVIPNGVGKPFEPQSPTAINRVKTKYGLLQPYFLFVGTYEPRKNLATLFKAWEIFQARRSGFNLVLVGAGGRVFARERWQVWPARSLGYLPDQDLPAIYAGGIALVMPSLYEGFELTTLEAMACGTPVIASNTTSFPEVVGEAALLVNPLCAEEIAEAMCRVVDDPSLVAALRESALERAALFTWDRAAHQTLAVLEEAFNEASNRP